MKYGLMALLFIFTQFVWSASWHPKDQYSTSREKVSHLAFSLNYDHDHKNPRWVAYELQQKHLVNCTGRSSFGFIIDIKLSERSADPTAYRSTGYDRGHLAPAGDMKWSREAMRQSFVTSNITPQTPSMNRGRWAMLEKLVRAWASESSQLYVVTGPVLNDYLERLGSSIVSIPEYHYKVILRKRNGKWQGIGFLLNQSPQGQDLKNFVMPIRDIENITGINFFPHLSTSESIRLEENVELDDWNFKAKFQYAECPKNYSSIIN